MATTIQLLEALGETVLVGTQQDASQAMSTILKRYADLSAQGEKLRQVLVNGGKVPCAVWGAYNQACLDYIAKSQLVFDQLAQKGIDVDQVVYSAGKPVPDPQVANAYKTIRVTAPLRPPAFGFISTECPGTPMFQDAGWVPVPIGTELGTVSLTSLASLGSSMLLILSVSGNPLGAAGYSGYKALKAISVWMADYNQPAQIVAAFTDCFARLVKGGMTPAGASTSCSNAQVAAQQYAKERAEAESWGFWSWVGVGAAVLVAGGGLALYLRGRVSRAAGAMRSLVPAMAGFGEGNDGLHERIAAALGWRVRDTYSMSMQSLRELVRPVSAKLAAELTRAIQSENSMIRERRWADRIAIRRQRRVH